MIIRISAMVEYELQDILSGNFYICTKNKRAV